MSRSSYHLLSLICVLALFVAGCKSSVAAGLDERDANLVADALNRAGLEASKEIDPGGENTYRVMVAQSDAVSAITTLREHDLPPRHAPGVIDAVGQGALVPSPLAEHTQYVAGLSGDLERSLSSVEGVLGARVHLAVPNDDPLAIENTKMPTASVLIRHRGASPPIGEKDVQRLVAGSVATLKPEAVSVVMIPRPESPPLPARSLAHIGPIAVSEATATPLRIGLAVVVILVLGLMMTILVLWIRMRTLSSRLAGDGTA